MACYFEFNYAVGPLSIVFACYFEHAETVRSATRHSINGT